MALTQRGAARRRGAGGTRAGDAGRGSDEERGGQLAVVTISHAAQHVYVAGLAVAYPFVVTGLHATYAELGIVIGVCGVLGGLLQGLAGPLRRVSARLLLSGQNLGLGVAALAAAVAPSFGLFGAARAFGSLVSWPQHPVGSAVLAERYRRRRAYALSWHVAGGSIGTAVVPIVTSVLIAADGWRVGVGFLAAPLALGGLLVAWRLQAPAGAAPAAPAAPRPRRRFDLSLVRAMARRREVMGAMVAGTVAAGGRGLGTLTVFVPAYLKSGLHFAPVTIGVLFTVLVVGSIGGPVLAGHVADRLGRRIVLVVVYLVGAGTIGTFVLVGRGLVALGAVGLLIGVFAYAEAPLLQAVFSEGLTDLDQQSAFGLFFAVSYGVGSLWTIGLGFAVDRLGFRTSFFIMALSFLAAAAVVVWSRPRHGTPGAAAPAQGDPLADVPPAAAD